MMGLISLLGFLFILVFMSLPIPSVGACNFPTFMQTNGQSRDWRGVIKSQNTEFTLMINVTGNTMKTIATDNTERSHDRACLQDLGNDKYLVAHEESGQTTPMYTCVQFLRRSNSVIQIKEAISGPSMNTDLCLDANLKLNSWLIIDQKNVHKDVQLCPLQGGFSIRIFDKSVGKGVCDGLNGQTRIESECAMGEGLFFYFRQYDCVPNNLYMYDTQRTLCLASWQEGQYAFILLKHSLQDFKQMWVLRYPASPGDSFIANLLMDLSADMYSHISTSDNYLRLDMVRDTPRPANALCLDEYELCTAFTDICDDPKTKLTCPRTCGLCDETKPVVCNFQQKHQAQWYDAAHPATLALTINSTVLTTYKGQHQEKYHCVRWDSEVPDENRYINKQMLVKEFNNGCRPRYSCVEFMQQTNTVLFLKLSQESTWPFTKTPDEARDCSHFSFADDTSLMPTLFETKYLNLVYLRASNSVQCDMPQDITNYVINFKRGTQCTVSINYNAGGNSFSLDLPNCTSDIETQFTCVDSSRMLPRREQLVVTRSKSNPDLIHCWFFPKRQTNVFYFLSAKECNEAIRKRLNKDRLRYLAVFSPTGDLPSIDSDNKKTVPITVNTPPNTPSSNKKPPYNNEGPKYKDTTEWVVNDDPNVIENENDTDRETVGGEGEGDDFKVTATSVAVVGVVFTFAVLQTLCICKS